VAKGGRIWYRHCRSSLQVWRMCFGRKEESRNVIVIASSLDERLVLTPAKTPPALYPHAHDPTNSFHAVPARLLRLFLPNKRHSTSGEDQLFLLDMMKRAAGIATSFVRDAPPFTHLHSIARIHTRCSAYRPIHSTRHTDDKDDRWC
jgi:hypothetical protein